MKKKSNPLLFMCFLSCTFLQPAFSTEELKMHALYLMQNNQVEQAFSRYQQFCQESGKYDFETLQQMGLILLQKSIQSQDPQTFLMALFGAGISGSVGALEILEKGLLTQDPQIQMIALHFISQIDDDKASDLLNKAMSSDFLSTRMEAAFYLCQRKHPHAVGQLEGLMFRLPPVFKPYFPSFFAIVGTSDATATLKRLLEDPDHNVRIETILNLARTSRDDFLPQLRRRLTHSHIAELEATIFAVGALKDGSSLQKIKKLTSSNIDSIKLAAACAVYNLGDRSSVHKIIEMAKQNNLFAISALGHISDTENVLVELLKSSDYQVKINAGISLLHLRDPRCFPALTEILISDARDLAFQPVGSIGRTLSAFRAIPSAELHSEDPMVDLSYCMAIREHLLREAVHLPEDTFLKLATIIFQTQQNDLVPTTISLLENLRTDKAIALLKEGSKKITSPLIRDYCHLSLYRLKVEGPYQEYVNHFVKEMKNSDIIKLRPMLPWKLRMEEDSYGLSAEETSKLLIDSFLSIANRREEKSIMQLLETIQNGNPQNRPALMGLIMRATE